MQCVSPSTYYTEGLILRQEKDCVLYNCCYPPLFFASCAGIERALTLTKGRGLKDSIVGSLSLCFLEKQKEKEVPKY